MKIRWTVLSLWVTLVVTCFASNISSVRADDIPPLEERAKWFHHDRFGMFIHWGVYALDGRGEWVQSTAKIPKHEYIKLPPKFDPKDFDAAEWVALAKRAGQKYIVITTKHHDGFCMFDSKQTDYTIMNTPFGRDICKELADECQKQGVKLGFYYSILDWHHPDYVPLPRWDRKKRSAKDARFERYVEYMKNQIRELMTGYGPITVLWFDGNWHHKKPADKRLLKEVVDLARQLQPNILINDRAGIGGDYKTPEQRIPATGIVDEKGRLAMWEACMTMTTGHGSFPPTGWWGYDKDETVFKPTEELLHKLVDVTSKGGNFLLNVGPEPTGRIRPEEAERLEAVGRWMTKYGESIYGTTASPFRHLPFFGRVTQKGNRLYVHVFDWPEDRWIVLPGLKNKPVKASLLGRPNEKVRVQHRTKDVLLKAPKKPSDSIDSVIVLDFDEPPVVEPWTLRPREGGKIVFPGTYAEIRAKHGQRARPMSEKGRAYVGNWSNPNDIPTWCFTTSKPGIYKVRLFARPASDEAIGQRVEIRVGKKRLVGKITKDGVQIKGTLDIPAGEHELSVRLRDAKRTGPEIIDLFGVTLVPKAKP